MNLLRPFFTVGSGTMASRLLGFVREIMMAALIGVGPIADAFYAAFQFPNLFRRILAEGAFNTAFVPLFGKELEEGGPTAARRFAESVFSVLLLALVVLTILCELAMPFLITTIIVPRFEDPEKIDITILYARIMFPYLAALSLVALLSGILNTFRKYALAAIAPVLLNVILVSVLGACYYWQTGNSAETGTFLSWGVFASGLAQLGLLIFGVRRMGFGLSLRLPRLTPGVKRLLILAIPAALTGGITQINLLVGRIIASAQDGAIAILQYADRIYQLPLSVVGIAIGVVLLPELVRQLKSDDRKAAFDAQIHSFDFAMFLTLPAAAALAIIPTEIVSVLFERGAFTADNSQATALALAAFAVGLPSFVLIKVFSPGFFAREDTKTPMWFAGFSALSNMALSLFLFPRFGFLGIAIASSIAGWVHAFGLGILLTYRGLWQWPMASVIRFLKVGVASVSMSLYLLVLQLYLGDQFANATLFPKIMILLAYIFPATIAYFGIAFGLGVYRPRQFMAQFRQKSASE